MPAGTSAGSSGCVSSADDEDAEDTETNSGDAVGDGRVVGGETGFGGGDTTIAAALLAPDGTKSMGRRVGR